MPPFAHVLHIDVVRRLAGSTVYQRGEAYFRDGRVITLRQNGSGLIGTVRGAATYDVRIWVAGDQIAYSCGCPYAQEAFCKHGVALSLAWLEQSGAAPFSSDELRAKLERLNQSAFIERLLREAQVDTVLRRTLERLLQDDR